MLLHLYVKAKTLLWGARDKITNEDGAVATEYGLLLVLIAIAIVAAATALGVARGYAGLIDRFVLDAVDAALAPEVEALGIRAVVTDTIMTDDASRARLAASILAAARG